MINPPPSSPAQLAIETNNLRYRAGKGAKAFELSDLNLRVPAGSVFGFLGPNGSGKTTTILMLLGLTEPTDGRAVVAGFDPLR